MTDPYSFWRRAIEITGGKRSLTRDEQKALVVTEEPQAGFFKRRTMRAGPFVPVAIWLQGDYFVAVQDGKAVAPEDIWTYACPHPITESDYRHYTETGQWPGEDMAVRESLEGPPKAPTLGDNLPPPETLDQEIARQIEAASANLSAYANIQTDEAAASAQSVRSRLLELSGKADKARVAEKAPHLEASRAVDSKWQPIVGMGKDRADTLRRAIGDYETAKFRAAEQARRIAEEEGRRAASITRVHGETPPPAPTPEPPAPAPATTVRGSYGRAASVKDIKIATITDMDAFWPFVKAHPEVIDLFVKLAQRAVDKDLTPPGVSVETRKDVR